MKTDQNADRAALVVTTIQAPNPVLQSLAAGAKKQSVDFIVVGDAKSPREFTLDGARYYDLDAQLQTPFRFAQVCPQNHYARKNIGYLLAFERDHTVVIETDDDNFPYDSFWRLPEREVAAYHLEQSGWTNVYRYYSETPVWPRGFSVEHLKADPAPLPTSPTNVHSPIHQGLANRNPDVDAIFRLIFSLPIDFDGTFSVALGPGAWCPFNSQNTIWWREAFPLMYLPAHCSFRMTDIWRSFVAQRIAHENGWPILFHPPTVYQERNEHNLLKDLSDEVVGLLNNGAIMESLAALSLRSGAEHLTENLKTCYDVLIRDGLVGEAELPLLDAWERDLTDLGVV